MVGYGNQPPSSPSIHGNQPPSSPMMHGMPNSPMPRSPMVVQSPMGLRRAPNSSPAHSGPSESPRSVYSSHVIPDLSSMNDHTGGGNPHDPMNSIPAPPSFGRFGSFNLGLRGGRPRYFKLGLKGGAPMWGFGQGAKRPPNMVENKDDKAEPQKFKKESHLSKVSILKRKSPAKTNLAAIALARGNVLTSGDYNDESSSTPPVTPPPSTSRLAMIQKGKKIPGAEQEKEVDSCSENKEIEEMMEYEDESDGNVVQTEVTLSSTAQTTDGDDMTVIQTFSQSDLGDVISSPLEGSKFLLLLF